MRIGLISDTHQPIGRSELAPEIHEAFAGVDLVMHGGDIVNPVVLDWLEEIAPVVAARGNNDIGWLDPRVQDIQIIEEQGLRIAMMHDMEPEDRPIADLRDRYLDGEHADIIVTGDTHFERLDYRDEVLQINSGSPTLPHHWSYRLGTVALLEIERGEVSARIVRLGETAELRNPGIEYSYARETGVVNLG